MKFAKHNRQQNREYKNFSKSIKLDVKKFYNRLIKQTKKDKNLSEITKVNLIRVYSNGIESLNLR